MTGLLFGVFILLLLLGVPIAFSVALAGIAVLVDGNVSLMMIAQKIAELFDLVKTLFDF